MMQVATQKPQFCYFDASTLTDDICPQEPTRTSTELIEGNDTKTRFYTGLQSWKVFLYVFFTLVIHIIKKKASCTGITQQEKILLVFMRLRLNPLIKALAY